MGAFTQYYGSDALDASLLMIPLVGFLPATDERVRSTIEVIERGLTEDGFVLRYRTEDTGAVDGLTGHEGAFLACSFWMADCLYLIGRYDDAHAMLDRLIGLRNDLGLAGRGVRRARRAPGGQFPAGLLPRVARQRRLQPVGPSRHGAAADRRRAPAAQCGQTLRSGRVDARARPGARASDHERARDDPPGGQGQEQEEAGSVSTLAVPGYGDRGRHVSTTEIAPGIVEIDTLLGGWEKVTAGYLVHGDAPVLVETGSQSSVRVLLDALDALGVSPDALAGVAVTHIHLDHAGGVGDVARAFPAATVYVHEKGARHLVDPTRLIDSAARGVRAAPGLALRPARPHARVSGSTCWPTARRSGCPPTASSPPSTRPGTPSTTWPCTTR